MMQRIGRKLLRIAFFSIYSVLILEITCRLVLSIDPIFDRILGFDESSGRLGWIRRHQETNHAIMYSFDIYDPTKGWVVKPNVTNMPAFEGELLNTNSRGIRGKVEYSYDKPADKVRILVLGDSFTFGEEVGDNEHYVYYLQQMLPEAEVINFGVHGYGHDQMLIYLQEEGVKYKPDIVMLGFIDDDMYRNMMAFRDYAKPKFKLAGGKLELAYSPVVAPEEVLEQEIYRSRFFDVLYMLYEKIMWKSGVNAAKMEELTAAILDEIAKTSRDIGATPVFVYLPDEIDERTRPGEEYLLNYCKQRELACVSVVPNFKTYAAATGDTNIRLVGGHWKPEIHELAAQGIADYLLDGLLRRP
jgi:hypothetical protein